MAVNSEVERIRRLEQKVDRLIWLCGIQITIILTIAAHYSLSQFPAVAVAIVVALPALYLFRRMLPRWGRRLGQFVGAAISGRSSSSSKSG